jgi:hypothetical protein
VIGKKLAPRLLKRLGGFAYSNGICYIRPVEHILSGITIDRTPSYIYLLQVYIPICDRLKIFSLSCADRLTGSFSGLDAGSSDSEIIERIANAADYIYGEMKRKTLLPVFLDYCKHFRSGGHMRARRSYANACILFGDKNSAISILSDLFADESFHDDRGFADDTTLLFHSLERDERMAKQLVLEWELETRERFGV